MSHKITPEHKFYSTQIVKYFSGMWFQKLLLFEKDFKQLMFKVLFIKLKSIACRPPSLYSSDNSFNLFFNMMNFPPPDIIKIYLINLFESSI